MIELHVQGKQTLKCLYNKPSEMVTPAGNLDLQLMVEYNFKEPINATVLYYDSDDETKASTAEKEEQNKNIDKIISEIFTDINKLSNEANHEPVATSSKRKRTSEARNSKMLKLAENTGGNNMDLIFQNNSKASYAKAVNHDRNISKKDQSLNISQITTLQESNDRHSLTFTSTQINLPQNQDDLNKKTNECLQILLNTVSVHLIFIMKAYQKYITISKRTSDITVIEAARKHFQNTRTKFFYLSFSTVLNIMLPKENDIAFIDHFIDDTVKLGKTRKFICKHYDMKLLCTEMFSWTKSHIQHPLLADLLDQEPQPREQINTNSNNEEHSYDTCVVLSGPNNGHFTNATSTIIQNSQNTEQPLHDIVQNVPSRQNTQPSNYELTNNLHSITRNCNLNREVQYKSSRPRANNLQMQSPSCHYTHSRQHQTLGTQQNHSMDELANSAHYNSYCQADQGQIMEVHRSSVSRDSGYTSPLSSVSCDPMCGSSGYNRIDSSPMLVTPMITHVTSLNPSVAYIKDGQCYVCGKLTKQKCLGCYKIYYCSIDCQNSDWKYHALVCK